MVHLGFRVFDARIIGLPNPLLIYGRDPGFVKREVTPRTRVSGRCTPSEGFLAPFQGSLAWID